MNLPNKLTLLRVILVPFFLLFLLVDAIPLNGVWALIVFAAASITDALDGHIARSRNLVTDFGKFLDPVADKVLVFSALIAFTEMGLASSVPVVIMIAREFLVSSLRMVAAANGKVIAAGKSGKIKTAVTMVSIVAILLLLALMNFGLLPGLPLALISNILIWICGIITVYSGVEYLVQNKEQFTSSM
ncbi:MAG: CDP-diacylglycerol--glycerol-3-phosphate 3-phosphatidyltransferase [Erysipelotrichaceae bacterium]|nr:CDP-diacylglycerol--glycerol-3-phosphate 3-phosphatidyltransferase [Erysipelotrichaceae bacterium]